VCIPGKCLSATGTGGITGSGTLGYIPMWNGTTNLNNSVIYQSGGNIGIGTTSIPSGSRFVINSGSQDLNDIHIITSQFPNIVLENTGGETWEIGAGAPTLDDFVIAGGSPYTNHLTLYGNGNSTWGTNPSISTNPVGGECPFGYHWSDTDDDGVIDNGECKQANIVLRNNNVGIGTTNPGTYKLNVAGNINASGFYKNGIEIGDPVCEAGNILLSSANTQRSTTSTTLVKLKEIKIGCSGSLRIYYEWTQSGSSGGGQYQIRRNGVVVDDITVACGAPYPTFCNRLVDISGWSPGDLVQIYARVLSTGTVYVQNFTISVAKGIIGQVTQD
ncbi:MAG: hypothetical protein QXO27_04400, partial [Candidatus Aenigmatarchaeota archaeon]